MFKKPVFWIIFVIIFIISVIFTLKYFPKAYPLVTLDLKMDRQNALKSANELARKYEWGPVDFRQASSFRVDTRVQNFVELEAGGTEPFRKMLKEDLYSPYTWQVRHFKEGETNETLIRFTPGGRFYGFIEKLPEDKHGESLTSDFAYTIARSTSAKMFEIDLESYELVEQSREIRSGGRTDHTLIFERPDIQIGDGYYRIQMTVSGNRLTEVSHFIKIPEAFSLRYKEMRSTNDTIASTAIMVGAILYILGGCIIGIFILLRQHWILWRKPLFWGFLISFFQVLAIINFWPLAWMDYDTALSAQGFLFQQIVQLLLIFVGDCILLSLTFMAAESLTRKAFPDHIQFWRIWSSDVASSKAVFGRTTGGFLLVGVFFAFDVAFYFFANKLLGWWTPSGALFEPDVLAAYFPWLTSFAVSLHAGFWEECLFRAIPIAGAALLGKRFGRQKLWIIGAFIIQALIFGAGHANYPQQPAYARVVELIIPSIAFGLIYLKFGLFPAIILHFVIDVVWIALPLFVSTAPEIWSNKIILILLTMIPFWIILWAKLRSKKWNKLKEDHFNRSWKPPEVITMPAPLKPSVSESQSISSKTHRLVIIGGIIGLIIWFWGTNFHNNTPPLDTRRKEAIKLAKKVLAERNIEFEDTLQVLTSIETPMDQNDRFIWQTGNKEDYKKLMGTYLSPPYYKVRFVSFKGDVARRAEEYQVYIHEKDRILRFRHKLPEKKAGSILSEEEARTLALNTITNKYQLNSQNIKEISATPSKQPARKDWLFTFTDTVNYSLDKGEARIAIQISGDEVTDAYRFIHIPEEWERQERNRKNIITTLQTFSILIMFLMFAAAIIGVILKWTRKNFSIRVFITFLIIISTIKIIDIINQLPQTMARFSTAEPLSNQILMTIIYSVIILLLSAAGPSMAAGFIQSWKTESNLQKSGSIWLGFAVGLIFEGFSVLISRWFEPSLEPFWAKYDYLGYYIPLLGYGLNPVINYIINTLLFLFIFISIHQFTNKWTRNKTLLSLIFILLMIILTGTSSESIKFWLISGFIMGMIYLSGYLFVFRFQISLIPVAFSVFTICNGIKQCIMNAHPAAVPGALISIFCVIAVSVYWFKK
jgi:membrane protease YdiL (CAAX protease family)